MAQKTPDRDAGCFTRVHVPAVRSAGYIAIAAKLAVVLLMLLFAANVQAGKPSKTRAIPADKWAREPTSFMSLPLGGALPADRQCIRAQALATRQATSNPPAPCWQGESNVKTVYDLPSPGFQIDSVVAVLYNDTIGTVIVNGMRPEYAAMKQYLIATYGQPTQSRMKPMGQQGGLMLGVENLRWEGKYVAIELEEIYNRVDMFRVVAVYKPATLNTAMLTE
ncbi:MAG TPA: hypothetical protein VGO72_07025 [Herminiimonas sp.]|nr:hypothetical protein [Herminiimonas sp.]